ncbi:MAG: glutathione synthetase [Nitrospirota bacterium]|jgi:glutathione synthase
MKLAFYVNDIKLEERNYTTTRMAMAAVGMGHDVWYVDAEGFSLSQDDVLHARAKAVPKKKYKSGDSFMRDLQGRAAKRERITADDLDVLFLRSDPSLDTGTAFWRQSVGIDFGRLAMRRGVIVLNDPIGLYKAMNKMYFQHFPAEVRPATLITRDGADMRAFAKEFGTVVLKPLQGSGGKNVFLVRPEDRPNINQIIEAISRDGYVVAQEYLKGAEEGDMRLFLVNGLPFRYKGKYAAFRRVRSGGDLRSNIHAGGKLARATVDRAALKIAEMVRPKIVLDGMFMVGLDIVGDKLLEINVFSPGGLRSAQSMEGVNFSREAVRLLERKVEYVEFYHRNFDNVEIATL